MADRLTIRRDIAVLTRYVFQQIRENDQISGYDPTFTQRMLGAALRGTPSGQKLVKRSSKKFNESHISKLMSGGESISAADHALVPLALLEFMETKGISKITPGEIPFQLYVTHRKSLSATFGDFANYIPRSLLPLGAVAAALQGMWRLFYVPADPGQPGRRVVHSNVVFFHKTDPDDTRVYGMMIGPERQRWFVSSWLADRNHLYFFWGDTNSDRSSLVITGLPELTEDGAYKFVGLATFLDPPDIRTRVPPIIAALSFGTSCTIETCFIGDQLDSIDRLKPEARKDFENTVKRALEGSFLTATEEADLFDKLRGRNISVDVFANKFMGTANYVREYRDRKDIFLGIRGFSSILDDPFTATAGEIMS